MVGVSRIFCDGTHGCTASCTLEAVVEMVMEALVVVVKAVKVGMKETKVGKNCFPNCQLGAYGMGYPMPGLSDIQLSL
jgi:hypothetical protein